MPRDQVHVNVDPNMDGPREGVIADADGDQLGISRDTGTKTTPFHVKEVKKDPELAKFAETFEK
ncbi:hypothetical protein [Niallia sp.]|uniref:hypothetical protein n=1 Tax=Niallia sp. TaxID=2837523 RepID=UPI00289A520B|nr:hypothetical protein [Niallia sp.]